MDFYERHYNHSLKDVRVGQVTPLPLFDGRTKVEDQLMTRFNVKTRNSIRKAQKSELSIYHSGSIESIRGLSDLHRQNMEAMGGLAKSWSVFEAIRDIFTYDKHYRVYMAEKDGP